MAYLSGIPGAIYEPLNMNRNEFRLLRLKPRSHNRECKTDQEQIICYLERATIEEGVKYFALSYTWENGFNPQSITLSNCERFVSANLVDALRQMRQEAKDVVLWIDQLCINQEDEAEKASQINNMRSIYQRATRVIAWLGAAKDDSDLVFTTFSYLERYNVLSQRARLLSAIAQEMQHSLVTSSHRTWDASEVLETLKTALPAFAARRYWNRLWVLQEFVLARDLYIMCGSKIVTVLSLEKAWTLLKDPPHLLNGISPSDQRLTHDIRAISKTWQHDESWWDAWLGIQRLISQRENYPSPQVIHKTMEFVLFKIMYRTMTTFYGQTRMACTDPRDRVFGLLGLSTDSHEFRRFPDYFKSIEETYEYLAQVFIQQGNIDTLSFCQEFLGNRARHMASWAADWSLTIRIPLWGKLAVNASNGWSAELDASILDSKTITITGVCVGTIQSHGDRWPGEKCLTKLQMQTYTHQLRGFCSKARTIITDNEEFACAQIAAPSALAHLGDEQSMLEEFQAITNDIEQCTETGTTESPDAGIHLATKYESELRTQLLRCPFLTGSGYVGIAPPYIEKGDCVCIFPGGRLLYVLRKYRECDTYQIVGAAYVHGIMNGEYIDTNIEQRRFTIV